MIYKIIAYFKEAYQSLAANKSRTILSMLGIIMGILSVVVLQTIGEGAQKQISSRLSSFGTNTITISAARSSNDVRIENIVDSSTFINDDMIRLLKKITTISYISPTQSLNSVVNVGNKSVSATIKGITQDYTQANSLVLYVGMPFVDDDYNTINYKGLIGAQLAEDLFEKTNPIGQKINVDNNYITIIGVLSNSDSGSPFSNPDNTLFVPLITMQKSLTNNTNYQSLSVVVDKEENMTSTKSEIEKLLQNVYVSKGGAAVFDVSSNSDLLASSQQIVLYLKLFLGIVAGISLLIGGIGIMNIMLVSVSERTREIGIRKAVGATYSDILLQFLCESSGLTLVSGLIGIFLSLLITMGLNKAGLMGGELELSSFGLMSGLSFSIGTGLLFGILPARKAALMKVVDALRFE